jgi:hypothetical protein
MAKWEVVVTLGAEPGARPHGLLLNAHSERGAVAQLARHRAAGARHHGLQINYATTTGARLPITWGQAGTVTLGPVRLAARQLPAALPPAPGGR